MIKGAKEPSAAVNHDSCCATHTTKCVTVSSATDGRPYHPSFSELGQHTHMIHIYRVHTYIGIVHQKERIGLWSGIGTVVQRSQFFVQ